MRGFRFRSCLKKVTRAKSDFVARVSGLRPKTGRPAAAEAPRRTREKNFWRPG